MSHNALPMRCNPDGIVMRGEKVDYSESDVMSQGHLWTKNGVDPDQQKDETVHDM